MERPEYRVHLESARAKARALLSEADPMLTALRGWFLAAGWETDRIEAARLLLWEEWALHVAGHIEAEQGSMKRGTE